MTKTYFQQYQRITAKKFDLEDEIATIGHEQWVMKNKKLKAHQQLKKKEDELRLLFDRQRLVFEEKEKNVKKIRN